ncbi:DUF1109 domain-containing protein [Limnobacter humi]|uniref:DUF1109 domain-containing protein n=1 Tax=Limnobacter humi TaxID=1778671 RepID=A0ABT1WGK3_9BURK|nr:DUF1109 domain-containing protein [Limnobacter humi]MCQ8896615.1 DUF1109 domain-containing protein [Limnobacter humi]
MKTDDLINMLSTNAGRAPARLAEQRLGTAALAGVLAAAAFSVAWLGLIPPELFSEGAPWLKLAYGFAVVLASGLWLIRLGRPAASDREPRMLLLGVVLFMVLLAGISFLATPVDLRTHAVQGHSWSSCPWSIIKLSMPALGAGIWAMRGLAPTQTGWAGFATGLFAGAAGSIGYALACDETATPFIAIWYTLGMLGSGVVGALVAPRFYRW